MTLFIHHFTFCMWFLYIIHLSLLILKYKTALLYFVGWIKEYNSSMPGILSQGGSFRTVVG